VWILDDVNTADGWILDELVGDDLTTSHLHTADAIVLIRPLGSQTHTLSSEDASGWVLDNLVEGSDWFLDRLIAEPDGGAPEHRQELSAVIGFVGASVQTHRINHVQRFEASVPILPAFEQGYGIHHQQLGEVRVSIVPAFAQEHIVDTIPPTLVFGSYGA
jgi:hypothetical protein